MRMPARPPRLGRCVSALALAAACAGGAAAADDGVVTLSITGREGARVRGWCRVGTPGGGPRLDLDEAVPLERRWRAGGLRCELDALDPVTVEAVRGGARSRASTTGGRVTITLR